MAYKNTYSLVPEATGGIVSFSTASDIDVVTIDPTSEITLSSSYRVATLGEADTGSSFTFYLTGGITTDVSGGIALQIFGYTVSDAVALYGGMLETYYDGTEWHISVVSTDTANDTLDGGQLVAASVPTTAYANESVTLDKVEDLTRGYIISGQTASNRPTALSAETDGQILIGDGTDINSVAMSGDVTIDNTGATTIGANTVTEAMLAYTPVEYLVKNVTLTAEQVKSMYTTPIEIIANPCDSGDAINIIDAVIHLDYGTTNYAAGGAISLAYASAPTIPITTVASTAATGGVDGFQKFTSADTLHTAFSGTGIVITCATQDFTLGDSTIDIKIIYDIKDLD